MPRSLSWAVNGLAAIHLLTHKAARRSIAFCSATRAVSSTEWRSAGPVAVNVRGGIGKVACRTIVRDHSHRGKCDGHEGRDNWGKLHHDGAVNSINSSAILNMLGEAIISSQNDK